MKAVLGLCVLFVCVTASASQYSVKECSYEEAKDLDSNAMDAIKSNNFSGGHVYTSVRLNPEESRYSGNVGHADLVLTKSGLQLMGFELCNKGKTDKSSSMSTANLSLKKPLSLNALVNARGKVKISLEDAYLNSDEHTAKQGSLLVLERVADQDEMVVYKAEIKLSVETTEEGNDTVETLTGEFFFSFKNVSLK